MFDLSTKTVLITGGAGILGSRISRALVGCGARLAIADRDGPKAEALAQQLGSDIGDQSRVRGYRVDVSRRQDLLQLQEAVERDLGEVNVLFNNIATKSANMFAPFDVFPLEDWNEVMSVNVTGAMLSCQVFGSAMALRGAGYAAPKQSGGTRAPDRTQPPVAPTHASDRTPHTGRCLVCRPASSGHGPALTIARLRAIA